MTRVRLLAALALLAPIAPPPASAEIAYVTGSALTPRVVVTRDDGSVLRSFPRAGNRPSLSLGGARVAWTSVNRRGDARAVVADVASGEILVSIPGGENAVLSPDGSHLAFASAFGQRAPGIYIAELPSGALTRIKGAPYGRIAWAPDATWLTFDLRRSQSSSASDVWRVEADGTALRNVTRNGLSSSPSVSPDGRRIAYTQVRRPPGEGRSCDGTANLATIRPDGGARRLLSSRVFPCPIYGHSGAVWASSRLLLAWLAGDDYADLITQEVGSGRLRQVTRLGQVSGFAASPNGRTVLYAVGGDPWSDTITLYRRPIGGGPATLVRQGASEPVWVGRAPGSES